MIAPDPAPAGPRPAAALRSEPDRSAGREPRRRGDGDFEAVLAGTGGARPGSGSRSRQATDETMPEAAVPPAAVQPAPEMAVPLAAVPAAPVDPAAGMGEAVEAASVAVSAPAPPAAAVVADVPGTDAAPAPVVADTAAGAAEVDAAPAKAGATPAPAETPVVPKATNAPGDAAQQPQAVPVPRAAVKAMPEGVPHPIADAAPGGGAAGDALPERRAEPGAEARPVEAWPAAPVAAAAATPAPAVPAATAEAATVQLTHDTTPPAWHLTADTGAVRGEAAVPAPAQPQAAAPQAVVSQLAVAIGRASDRRVEIRLDPPELGRVQIHLTPVDGGLQAMVLSDRPETNDLLRRHAELLARELNAAGYGSVSLDFAAGGETPAHDAPRGDRAHATAAPVSGAVSEAAAAVALAPAPRRTPSGGLDIRL